MNRWRGRVFGVTGLTAALGGIVLAAGWMLQRAQEGRAIPVLMYHGLADDPGADIWTVSREEFERHLRSLREQGYRSIEPDRLARAVRGRAWLPRRPVLITFDDGLESARSVAEPLLK